jgi:drug/metabolite transporter (DMT)-like permease
MSPSKNTPPVPPLLVLMIGIMAVSTASIFIRYAQEQAPSLVIASYRLTLATLVLAPIALTRHKEELSSLTRKELLLALISGIFLALHFASWITSLEYTTVANSVVFVTTTPLWVALLAPVTIKEPLSRIILVGMCFALAGGITIGLSDACVWSWFALVCPPFTDFVSGPGFWGDILALTGALMAAAYLLIGRSLRAKMTLIPYIFLVYGMAALVLLIIMFTAGQTPFGYPSQTYLWFFLLALIPQLLGHSTFNWALRYITAAYVSISLLGEPIGSTLLAYFLLQETPSALKIFGAILILAGIYIASKQTVVRKS